MESFEHKVFAAASYVKERLDETPKVGLIIGTGLGDYLKGLEQSVCIGYEEIPYFPIPTVTTHKGALVVGRIAGCPVVAMLGRLHYYEGFSIQEVSFPVRVMQLLGVKTVILSNAAGGIDPLFTTGDIMIITDHINLTGVNPLIGSNIDAWGPRFPDMSRVYDRYLVSIAERAALDMGVRVQKGVYAGLAGPSLETPAEIRFLRVIGADAVGLSTIPEVIAAVHGGMRVLAFSVITNMNLPDYPTACNVNDILSAAARSAPVLHGIIEQVIQKAGLVRFKEG